MMTWILLLSGVLGATPVVHANPAHAAPATQQAECVPATAEAQGWKVKTIYLHGLYPSTGEFAPEDSYRAALEATATRLHFRIAIPVSPSVHKSIRSWNSVSLAQMEAMAVKACGAELDPNRAILGFSNGGYAGRRIAQMDCRRTRAYSKIISIGVPVGDQGKGTCGSVLTYVTPHQFPPAQGIDYYLGYLSEKGGHGGTPLPAQVAKPVPPVTPPIARPAIKEPVVDTGFFNPDIGK